MSDALSSESLEEWQTDNIALLERRDLNLIINNTNNIISTIGNINNENSMISTINNILAINMNNNNNNNATINTINNSNKKKTIVKIFSREVNNNERVQFDYDKKIPQATSLQIENKWNGVFELLNNNIFIPCMNYIIKNKDLNSDTKSQTNRGATPQEFKWHSYESINLDYKIVISTQKAREATKMNVLINNLVCNTTYIFTTNFRIPIKEKSNWSYGRLAISLLTFDADKDWKQVTIGNLKNHVGKFEFTEDSTDNSFLLVSIKLNKDGIKFMEHNWGKQNSKKKSFIHLYLSKMDDEKGTNEKILYTACSNIPFLIRARDRGYDIKKRKNGQRDSSNIENEKKRKESNEPKQEIATRNFIFNSESILNSNENIIPSSSSCSSSSSSSSSSYSIPNQFEEFPTSHNEEMLDLLNPSRNHFNNESLLNNNFTGLINIPDLSLPSKLIDNNRSIFENHQFVLEEFIKLENVEQIKVIGNFIYNSSEEVKEFIMQKILTPVPIEITTQIPPQQHQQREPIIKQEPRDDEKEKKSSEKLMDIRSNYKKIFKDEKKVQELKNTIEECLSETLTGLLSQNDIPMEKIKPIFSNKEYINQIDDVFKMLSNITEAIVNINKYNDNPENDDDDDNNNN
jgi:hypothetical protein